MINTTGDLLTISQLRAELRQVKADNKKLQAQVIILQAERDAAAALCAEQHKKIQRLEKESRTR